MIAVIDYDAGNLYNVGHALKYLGADFEMSSDPRLVSRADKVILPGVGSARTAMNSLARQGLVETLRSLEVPFLGICLGLQLLYEESEEDHCPCLGILDGKVKKFESTRVKVPHMGWNLVKWRRETTSFEGLGSAFKSELKDGYFYFVHSYYAPVQSDSTVATSEYDLPFSAAVVSRNFMGVQFHPERSGETGLELLRSFAEL